VLRFIGRFQCGFSLFSQGIVLSDALHRFPFPLPGGATIFVKLWSKISKTPKISKKVCAHHFVQTGERFKKIPPQWFRDKNVDVHLYKNFLCTSLYSVDSQCQTSFR